MTSLARERVLVTGGSGFLGAHLTRRLVADGADVHVTSRLPPSAWRLRDVDDVGIHPLDVADANAVATVGANVRPNVVFHLAAFSHVGRSWQHVDECIRTNVQGTAVLLHALEQHACERFVFLSTSDVYGRADVPWREDGDAQPLSPYAASKLAAESYCRMLHRAAGMPVVILRPFSAYGPMQETDRLIPELIVRALRVEDIALTRGTQTREFTYVDDVVDAMVRAASTDTDDAQGRVFNVGSGEEVSVRRVVETVLDALGNPVTARFGARPERPGEITRVVSDTTAARIALQWAPTVTLGDGIARTVEWYRAHIDDGVLAEPS
jgi:UDP-glucose 4-epimerase